MTSTGIRDRVAIVGMGCTRFGELWDQGTNDLLTDAAVECTGSAGVAIDAIDAFWLGTLGSGQSGIALSKPLKIGYKPVTRVENFCATGSEAFRNACYAVASGAYELVMAIGVEKLKDSGYSGLTGIHRVGDGTNAALSSPAAFSFLVPAYCHKYGVDPEEMGSVLNRIAWKNHQNGAVNPRAQYPKGGLPREDRRLSTGGRPARGLRLQRGERRGRGGADLPGRGRPPVHRLPAVREGAQPGGRAGGRGHRPRLRLHQLRGGGPVGRRRLPPGRGDRPRAELAMAEVHDCFTPTELVLMEDLGFADRGTAWKEVMAGTFDRDGELPVNPDGGLKSFGHPIGATGLRMLFECWLQLRRQAPPERQIATVTEGGRTLGLTHNLGGAPGECVSFVGVVGTEPAD